MSPKARSPKSIFATGLAIILTGLMLNGCKELRDLLHSTHGPWQTTSVTPFPINVSCGTLNAPAKKYRVVIRNFNINHLVRDIKDDSGADANYPIDHAKYNTLYDMDFKKYLLRDGDNVVVRIAIKHPNLKFASYPDQITSGDKASSDMFCSLTQTGTEILTGYKYVEFIVKYAPTAGDQYHIGNFNINLLAEDTDPTTPGYTLPFSLDPHVGNNG